MVELGDLSASAGAVITIGELVVDWIAIEKSADWGEPDTFLRSAGGNAANVAHALSRLGIKARLVAKVGDDLHANYLFRGLAHAGIETTFVSRTSAFATAQCYVLTDQSDENLFFNWPKPNACHQLTVDDLGDELFEGAIALHATGISLTVEPRSTAVIEAMRRARQANLLVSFDAAFPTGEGENAKRQALEAMSLAHIIKVNLAELLYWLGDVVATNDLLQLNEYAQLLRKRTGAQVILLTLGATGSIIAADENHFADPITVDTLAGVGAGDAYVAFVLAFIVRQLAELRDRKKAELDWPQTLTSDLFNWSVIARSANAAGALATRTVSASVGLPTLAEIEQILTG
ncbi:carbohydrate kinase [soil metagenome]